MDEATKPCRPQSLNCANCGALFEVAPRGPVPSYCRRYCNPAHRAAKAAHELVYARSESGRAARNRASKAHHARIKDVLPDYIVANLLKMRIYDVPNDLIELKRQQLTVHRLARQLKDANHETSKDDH